jgi:methylthioribose-1-phosphate isomerase
MKVLNKNYRTIWLEPDDSTTVQIIDQRYLPHKFVIEDLKTVNDIARAIKDMHVRGAGLIGVTAGYGMYLAALAAGLPAQAGQSSSFDQAVARASTVLIATRPTAVNLAWAVNRQLAAISQGKATAEKIALARKTAEQIADEDVDHCHRLGEYGLKIIEQISRRKNGQPVNVLTHCNAGWLAFVDYGSATAPIYAAHQQGLKIHVWVSETRPRNQGASLTAWELSQEGVPHTVIADNTSGHLMQHGLVDLVIVGADRVAKTGDVANKIGTYLKALAAKDNNLPFYAALPSSTFDWHIKNGLKQIPIEERSADEVRYIQGLHQGSIKKVLLTPAASPAANYGFDVTPARLITGLITERGICQANEPSILALYPEHKNDYAQR